jgi:hypothetical protein
MGYLYQNTAALGFTTLPLLPLIRQRTLVLTGDQDRSSRRPAAASWPRASRTRRCTSTTAATSSW